MKISIDINEYVYKCINIKIFDFWLVIYFIYLVRFVMYGFLINCYLVLVMNVLIIKLYLNDL